MLPRIKSKQKAPQQTQDNESLLKQLSESPQVIGLKNKTNPENDAYAQRDRVSQLGKDRQKLDKIAEDHTKLSVDQQEDGTHVWTVTIQAKQMNIALATESDRILIDIEKSCDAANSVSVQLYSLLFSENQYSVENVDYIAQSMVERNNLKSNSISKLSENVRAFSRDGMEMIAGVNQAFGNNVAVDSMVSMAMDSDTLEKQAMINEKRKNRGGLEKELESKKKELVNLKSRLSTLNKKKILENDPAKIIEIDHLISDTSAFVKKTENEIISLEERLSEPDPVFFKKGDSAGFSEKNKVNIDQRSAARVDIDNQSGVVTLAIEGKRLVNSCGNLIAEMQEEYASVPDQKLSFSRVANINYASHLKAMAPLLNNQLKYIESQKALGFDKGIMAYKKFSAGYDKILEHGLLFNQQWSGLQIYDNNENPVTLSYGEIIELNEVEYQNLTNSISNSPSLVAELNTHRQFYVQRNKIASELFAALVEELKKMASEFKNSKELKETELKKYIGNITSLGQNYQYLVGNYSAVISQDVRNNFFENADELVNLLLESCNNKSMANPEQSALKTRYILLLRELSFTIYKAVHANEENFQEKFNSKFDNISKIAYLMSESAIQFEKSLALIEEAEESLDNPVQTFIIKIDDYADINKAATVALRVMEKNPGFNVRIIDDKNRGSVDQAYQNYLSFYKNRESQIKTIDTIVKNISSTSVAVVTSSLGKLIPSGDDKQKAAIYSIFLAKLMVDQSNKSVLNLLESLGVPGSPGTSSPGNINKAAAIMTSFRARVTNSRSSDTSSSSSEPKSDEPIDIFEMILKPACENNPKLIVNLIKNAQLGDGSELDYVVKLRNLAPSSEDVFYAYANYLVSSYVKNPSDKIKNCFQSIITQIKGNEVSRDFESAFYMMSNSQETVALDYFCQGCVEMGNPSLIVQAAYSQDKAYLIKKCEEGIFVNLLSQDNQETSGVLQSIYDFLDSPDKKMKLLLDMSGFFQKLIDNFEPSQFSEEYKSNIVSGLLFIAKKTPQFVTPQMLKPGLLMQKSISDSRKDMKVKAQSEYLALLASVPQFVRQIAMNDFLKYFDLPLRNINQQAAQELMSSVLVIFRSLMNDYEDDNVADDFEAKQRILDAAAKLLAQVKSALHYTEFATLRMIEEMKRDISVKQEALNVELDPDYEHLEIPEGALSVSQKVSQTGLISVDDLISKLEIYIEKKSGDTATKNRYITSPHQHYARQLVKIEKLINLIDLALSDSFDDKRYQAEMKRNPLTLVSNRQKALNIVTFSSDVKQDEMHHLVSAMQATNVQQNSHVFADFKTKLYSYHHELSIKYNETSSRFELGRKLTGTDFKPGSSIINKRTDNGGPSNSNKLG